jgi:Membrane bound beta barrel domain (DUF5777)
MKLKINKPKRLFIFSICLAGCMFILQTNINAQDSTSTTEEPVAKVKVKPVKNTFESIWIMDNQTVMVPHKGSFEMDIMHRFGTVKNGYDDFWGFFAPSNIRLGVDYAPINNLNLGIGITKNKMLWDGSAKYSIIKQTKGKYPVSVTYYGDMAYDTRKDPDKSIFKYSSQRMSFFNQLIVARKITDKFSIQVAASLSHQNSVPGYYATKDTTTYIFKEEKFDLFAASVCARYKLTEVTSLIIDYDQPLTRFATNNPHPKLAFGFEFNTSGHTFQLFAGNYSRLNPQQNSLYNTNNPFGFKQTGGTKVSGGQFLIGFNITRLWNF